MQPKVEKEDRKTIGALSQELLAKEQDTDDAVELQREIQGDSYEVELLAAVDRGKKKYFSDFYVVPINQRFRLLPNVIRTYFIDRISCPTPDYDQAVYKYTRKEDKVEFLWVIPDKHTCEYMHTHALEVDAEQRELLNFVLDFYDGTLLQKARKLNREESQSLVITS